jgi:hypothetical protein
MGDSQAKQIGNKFTGRIGDILDDGPPNPYRRSLYTGPSGSTRNAWQAGEGFGNSIIGNRGLSTTQRNALQRTNDVAGQYGDLGDAYDPNSAAYKTLRKGIADDTLRDINSQFAASGRFGGGSYMSSAGEGLGQALAGLDYGNMQNDINNQYRALDSRRATLGDVFGMGQRGMDNQWDAIGRVGQIGASRDADRQAKRLGAFDQWNRNNFGDIDWLGRINGAMGGGAAEGANEAPWWQQLLGGAIGIGGRALGGGAFGNFGPGS